MTSMLEQRRQDIPIRAVSAFALASCLVLSCIPPALAGAARENAKLGIRPVEQGGSFFDLSLGAGERRQLSVELENFGARAIAARTFSADAYTIPNGGFGAKLRSDRRTGTTLWLDYKEEVLRLAPRQAVRRTFSLAVPPETTPGDYITSLVIENEEPIRGGSGSVTINQVQRQAIAVAISVPGPRRPRLEFGGAKHSFVGERSVVAVAVRNTGNQNLRPTGRLVVRDDSENTVYEGRAAMDSFYANTDTRLEAPLDEPLSPGRYEARLRLEDREQDLAAQSPALPFIVSGEPAQLPAGSPASQRGSSAPWLIAGAAVLILLALVAGIILGRRQRPGSTA